MAKKNPRKKYRCLVEFCVECDGWSEELYRKLSPSLEEVKESVKHALDSYIYTEDIWTFGDVQVVKCTEEDEHIKLLEARKKKQFKQGKKDAIAGKMPATDELAYIQGYEKGLKEIKCTGE